ncbi:MAG: DUF4003 domain-containing protein [Desulfitobacteriia bacterium]|jgi:hypothetical protein
MKVETKEMADKLVRIYKQLKKDFRWKNSSQMNNLIALSYLMKGKEYFREDIERVNTYIKENTGPFSCYRQKSVLFSALLYLNYPDPEIKFDLLLDYENRLKEKGFRSYTYRPVTAYTLLLTCEPGKVDSRLELAYEIFSEMKKSHPWLTSGDDYPLSILLAGSGRSVSALIAEIEDMYESLNEAGFSKSNGLQFLSHILCLSAQNNWEKARKCRELFELFKDHKIRIYSANYGSLGLLTLLENESNSAALEVIEVCKYLSSLNSIRWLGRRTLFLTATSLVAHLKLETLKNRNEILHTNAYITIESIIVAQNAAMLGAICAAF